MIRSMTGFGRGEAECGGHRFRAEARSVNHRYFNANLRLPREYGHLESRLTAICAERVGRGHLNVQAEVEPAGAGPSGGPSLNRTMLDRYLEIVESLEALPGVTKRVTAQALLALPGVLELESRPAPVDDETFLAGMGQALGQALEQLTVSRDTEGAALERDFRARVAAIRSLGRTIGELAPRREARERERLQQKAAELLESVGESMDARIAQEIILLADRLDISEELTRLEAHLDHFEAELSGSAEAGVGRKLTFLLQELGREANTIGAKGNDAEIQQTAIEIKVELEKMREQAENVE